jgi:hypothetical protein
VLVAQALGEYGVSALVEGIRSGILNVVDDVTSLTPTQYTILVVAALLFWWLFSQRR